MYELSKQTFSKFEVNTLDSMFEHKIYLFILSKKIGIIFFLFGFLAVNMSWQETHAQSFSQASTVELTAVCASTVGLGPELTTVCGPLGAQPASAGVGTQSQPSSLLISQQLLKNSEAGVDGLDIKEEVVPGGSSDVFSAQWGERLNTFLTVGATHTRHKNNQFEQGYTATIPTVTLGAGYLITENLETGLAFNYSNTDADYHSGGGFEVDAYSPIFYVNFIPVDNAFTQLVLSYTRQDQTTNRIAEANNAAGTALNRQSTIGEFDTDQYSLNFLNGYDFAINNFTVGPRAGINATQWEIDAYQESSNTGLELHYNRQHQTSVQSLFGIAASYAHSSAVGVIIPQFSASWIHEFANNARTVNAQFVQGPNFNGFSFLTESPARDWAVIDIGVSMVMQKGLQAFVNFSTVQGNKNFESYAGNLGIKLEL